MTNRIAFFAAAAIAVGGLSAPRALADPQPGHDPNATQQPSGPQGHPGQTNRFDKTPHTPEANTSSNLAPDAPQIRSSLARVAEAALSGDFQSLCHELDKSDQARPSGERGKPEKPANASPDNQPSDLASAVTQLKKDWREKFGQDLGFEKLQTALNDGHFTHVVESGQTAANINDNARTAAGRIPPADRDAAPDNRSDIQSNGRGGAIEMRGTDHPQTNTGASSGPKHAAVTIPASHGAPEVRLQLTSDASGQWKLDLPKNVDRQHLETNLAKHLRQFDEQKGVWPNDPAEASRMAAHHIFLALAGKESPGSHNAAPHDNVSQGRGRLPNDNPADDVVPPGTSGSIDSIHRGNNNPQ